MIQIAGNVESQSSDRRRSLVSQAALFRDCPRSALDDLARRMLLRVSEPGTIIVAQDDPVDGLYILASGHVRLALFSESGRAITVGQLGPGEFFGETALLEQRGHSASVIALERVTTLILTREAFLAHAQAHPVSAVRLAADLSGRLCAAHRALAELALEPVEQRLIRTLERMCRAQGAVETDEGRLLCRRPTHQTLAQLVGTSRETITRTFSSLTKRRLIVESGDGLLLTRALLGPSRAARAMRAP